MAKQQLTEEKIGKLLSFIMGAIIGGKNNKVTYKFSKDQEITKRIKDMDKSYNDFANYLRKKYGKEGFDAIEKQTYDNLRKKGYNV